MSTTKKAASALISVFSKEGLEPIIHKLNDLGITIYSTGGTEKFIRDLGVHVVPVEDVTGYPSILGGRVKTLHPKVFGVYLTVRITTRTRQSWNLTRYRRSTLLLWTSILSKKPWQAVPPNKILSKK